MRAQLLLTAVAAFALALLRCSVGDLDAEGKACPCVAGYTCDTTTSTCVRGAVTTSSSSSSSCSSGSSSGALTDAAPGSFTVKLTAGWSTTESLRWDWETTGDAAAFERYELVVSDSEAIDAPTPARIVFDKLTNPELGSFSGRDPATPGRGWTVSDRLVADSTVFARLKVIAKDGSENVSATVSARTRAKPATEVLLLTNPALAGTQLDPTTITGTSDCFTSTACFQVTTTCPADTMMSCAFEIGVRAYSRSLSTITAQTFEDAFFDIAVRATPPGNPPEAVFDDVVLTLGPDGCPITGAKPCRFTWERGWSFRPNAEWRVVQVPLKETRLRTLDGLGRTMTFSDIEANEFAFRAFTLNGTWRNGTTISFDRAVLRY